MTASVLRSIVIISLILCAFLHVTGQVQVREEPFHKPVLENEYFRLLDVWIQPGDTSLYHIHSTPSLFLYLSDTKVCVEEKGKDWISDVTKTGYSWYRSFDPDSLVHRVANCDTVPLNVIAVELLSTYHPEDASTLKPLPLTLLYENEKVFAYQLSEADLKEHITTRGPMLAEVTTGQIIVFNNMHKKEGIKLTPGQYVYIEPGTTFYFTYNSVGDTGIVLFEIK